MGGLTKKINNNIDTETEVLGTALRMLQKFPQPTEKEWREKIIVGMEYYLNYFRERNCEEFYIGIMGEVINQLDRRVRNDRRQHEK